MGEKSAHRTAAAAAPWEKLYLPLFRRYGVEISIKGFGCSASSQEQKCKSPALISEQFVMLSVCQCVLAAVPFWLKYSHPSSPFLSPPLHTSSYP